MLNRAGLSSHLVVLLFVLGLLVFPQRAVGPQPRNETGSEDLALNQSDKREVGQALDSLQTVLNALNSPQTQTQKPSKKSQGRSLIAVNSQPQEPPSWDVALGRLALAGGLGLVLALVYGASHTGKKKKYRPSMMQSQLLLCVGGAMVWLIVANSLVRAFGLGGMLGFIRYRTVLRDPKDLVVVFLSMAIGMSCGLGQVYIALVSTGFISFVLLAMYRLGLGKEKEAPEPEEPSPVTTRQD